MQMLDPDSFISCLLLLELKKTLQYNHVKFDLCMFVCILTVEIIDLG